MSSEISISIENVSKVYEMYDNPRERLLQLFSSSKKYYKEFWALKNINFHLRKGETVGILGRNGSGKSTLLQIIAGTLEATQGCVTTSGVVAALLELGSGFNPDFTGRENIYLNGSILGFSREQMDNRIDEIIAFADIGQHLDQPVKTYSSGMAVRLAFAVQACIEPQIFIVDEALAVGDEKFQRKCYDYIEKLRKKGCSILLVTHSTGTIEKFCQRAVLLHKGEMHAIGSAKDVIDQYHALLYSDEQAYIRFVNSQKERESQSSLEDQTAETFKTETTDIVYGDSDSDSDGSSKKQSITRGLSAQIVKWGIFDSNGKQCELFNTGECITVTMQIESLSNINEIQAGLLLRTVEGVSVYGTSTRYHDSNLISVKCGDVWNCSFNIKLDLCPGSYFITLAIAEVLEQSGMAYLDRKTDVMVIKVNQRTLKASGIASLETQVEVLKQKG
ncbi:ABC transporter ATP-binding protein [Citrobacter sp. wls618]|uniref:ABC transporter ATP-binding protein n=1 Tax=Citrobacter werkmanii TaxID=67827 RepID=A0A2Z4BXW8_9ENTR|nr:MULTISPECIES: ABC transporter ATP-binding protein [unclassified Citrobacter]AWU66697.1 ABC transporter ATP-binding protein [Citrobacter werkmanii]TKU27765.1 ABC transporter ATP-binding protein [Citrobacter sp. wls758]TKV01413.1 ABC transporter ATP-binding protein [Citrobacter sp. wls618]